MALWKTDGCIVRATRAGLIHRTLPYTYALSQRPAHCVNGMLRCAVWIARNTHSPLSSHLHLCVDTRLIQRLVLALSRATISGADKPQSSPACRQQHGWGRTRLGSTAGCTACPHLPCPYTIPHCLAPPASRRAPCQTEELAAPQRAGGMCQDSRRPATSALATTSTAGARTWGSQVIRALVMSD
jgi:hypothetical protein